MNANLPVFDFVDLTKISYAAARRLIQTEAPVYLAINPQEYHGPHLSLQNDGLISLGLARDLHAGLLTENPDWPMLWAGDLLMGVDPIPAPGSRPTTFSEAKKFIDKACRSLAELGAKRVILMTFHGAPLHNLAIFSGLKRLEQLNIKAVAPFNIFLRESLFPPAELLKKLVGPIADSTERQAVLKELPLDIHAGFGETSLALYYAPDSVSADYQSVPACAPISPHPLFYHLSQTASKMGATTLAAELKMVANGLGWLNLKPFPGYTSRPYLANTETGEILARYIIAQFVKKVTAVFLGKLKPPKPILAWLEALTLSGRLNMARQQENS